ncbi:HAD family phosphatase [Lutibacter sp.]|uniref:HAD family hydrolase n=1 Tax=Lutibacter sp. TaxID=1925666 RepID=UPI0025B90F74|nr:HAD family phosphatase [Lutibacter sp.]MCF6181062.1 HAD family phosphatase [Lutibacter sp.]
MKNKINTIIFDLGGVLVDWNPKYVYRKVFNDDEEKMQWFLNTVCTSDWNMQQDEGRTIEEAVNLKIAEFPKYEEWIRLYYKEWHRMFSGSINENVTLFKKLKATNSYKIYALTNWSAEKWELALELFPFFNEFDGIVVSGQEKTRKPHLKIYKTLFNRYHIIPEKAIFIDDNKENIIAAKQLNLNGIHYTNYAQLLQRLEFYKIIF